MGLIVQMNLDELRSALTELDGELLDAGRPPAGAQRAGRGRQARDGRRHARLRPRARGDPARPQRPPSGWASRPDLAESLLRQLIQSSLATQEQARVAAQGQGSGKRALVIGGRGKMGGWFCGFPGLAGISVTIADPRAACRIRPAGRLAGRIRSDCDLIVLATPLSATADIAEEAGAARAARLDLRFRVAEDAAARGPRCAGEGRVPGDLAASHVRSGHRIAVRPARDFHRSGRPGGAAGGAGAVRARPWRSAWSWAWTSTIG